MKLRIAFTFAGGSTYWTGGLNYLRNAFKALRIYGERVSPVLFIGPAVSDTDAAILQGELDEPIKRAPWLAPERRTARMLRAVLLGADQEAGQAFREHGIDVVFEAGEYFGSRFPIPLVTWIADFQSHHLPKLFRWQDRWRTYLGRRMQFLGSRLILLSSQDAQRDCWHFYPASRGRTVVVPFSVLPVDSALPTEQLLERYGLPRRFLYLPNQFWKHKNHLLIIEALALARQTAPELVVAASGSAADYRQPGHFEFLRSRVSELGLESSFRFLGLIPLADVRGLMEMSVAVVNPSLFEGWSTTVEEAKALGVPLVLSALAVHREQAGEQAIYFHPQRAPDAARALLKVWQLPADGPADRRKAAATDLTRRAAEFARRLEGVFVEAHEKGRLP